MEAGEDYLCRFCVVNGSPLSYTVRNDLKPIRESDDPSTSYSMLDEEIVACDHVL